jgi:hypothetical protein
MCDKDKDYILDDRDTIPPELTEEELAKAKDRLDKEKNHDKD